MTDITIDAEFQSLIPPLRPEELAQLEANVLADGIRDPLVVWDGVLIDGHNRYGLAQKHTLAYQVVQKDFADRDAAVLWIVYNQFGRRNLLTAARAELAMRIEPILAQQAKARQVAGLRRGDEAPVVPNSEQRKVKDLNATKTATQAAEAAGLKRDTYHKAKTVLTSAPAPIVEAFKAGKISAHQAYQQVRREERRERLEAETAAEATATYEHPPRLICGRFQDADVADDSVDAIITDPPYPREFLPEYTDFAAWAARKLKPGGSAFVMCGQSWLPEVLERLTSSDQLAYRWTLAYLTPGGQAVQVFPRTVNTFWKPVIWLTKGDYTGDWIGDVAQSKVNDNDKRFHEWGQSESGMADLIRRGSRVGDVVCDPFAGGGTTVRVAAALGRQTIGIECDVATYKTLVTRVNV
jgi:16S rRNA G966 N2-methylase RsmD